MRHTTTKGALSAVAIAVALLALPAIYARAQMDGSSYRAAGRMSSGSGGMMGGGMMGGGKTNGGMMAGGSMMNGGMMGGGMMGGGGRPNQQWRR